MAGLKYLIDTPALTRYLEGALPERVKGAFEAGEEGRATLFLPQIVVGEFVFFFLNGKSRLRHPKIVLEQVLKEMESAAFFIPAEMGFADWRIFMGLKVAEFHNRMLVAMAMSRKADAILTNNQQFKDSYRTLW